MEEFIRKMNEIEKRAAKHREFIGAALFVEDTTPPIDNSMEQKILLSKLLPKGLEADIKEPTAFDVLSRAAAAYNTLSKKIEIYTTTPLTPFFRKVVLQHETRHWEQDDYGRNPPSLPNIESEIDAQKFVLRKLEKVPEPMKTALLVQAFLLAFPSISSDAREVLEHIANGRDPEESFQDLLCLYLCTVVLRKQA